MPKLNLKNIIGKNSSFSELLFSMSTQLNIGFRIEDNSGRTLIDAGNVVTLNQYPVTHEEEILGWVKGDNKAEVIAGMLEVLLQKESEKKKLGNEVLNLYQELNLIFNFSEELAQTIEPSVIAARTLHKARHFIHSDSGIMVLWNEHYNKLQVLGFSGETVFNEEKLSSNIELLSRFVLNGQSEIVSDLHIFTSLGVVKPNVQSLIYAALKVKHRIMGAIVLARIEPLQYAAADLKLLITLALQSSAAIESALLFEKNIREAREREEGMRRIYEAAGKFVPFEFIHSLGKNVITDIRLGDQVEKVVTVLFTDIRNYTTLSEQMTPEENFRFVCSFNEKMGPVIRKHNGFINQYLGDAIMAIFPRSASDALTAAIEMQKVIHEFNRYFKADNSNPVQIGIGMHTGPLIMGITGDEHRMDATTISDAVNTASRIESLTKHYKTNIILTDSTLQLVAESENFDLRHLGMVQLKGKKAPVIIYECFSGDLEEEIGKKKQTLSAFNEGMVFYLQKSFARAASIFQYVIELHPNDLTAKIFLARANHFVIQGVPENWVGIEEMLIK